MSTGYVTRVSRPLALGFAALCIACSGDDQSCSHILVAALRVSVQDVEQNAVCDVTVRIEMGEEHAEKTLSAGDCTFAGGTSGPGTYKVTVEREGIVLSEQNVVVPPVPDGECNVETQDVTIMVTE